MGVEALKAQLQEGKITKEQFIAELKKLLDAGTIDQAAHDEALKAADGNDNGGQDEPLTAEAVRQMIADAEAKARQSAEDKMRREYSEKLKKEQEEKEQLLKDKMTEEEKAKFEREKFERELKEREAAIVAREVELHAIDKLTEAQLPLSFKRFLVGATKDDVNANVEAFTVAWQAELKMAVESKFKDVGDDPTKRKGGGGGQKAWKDMNLTERGELVKTDVELARQLAKAAGVNPRF